jgi:hypothetical protein
VDDLQISESRLNCRMNKCEWPNDLQTSESGVDYNHDKKQRQNKKLKKTKATN